MANTVPIFTKQGNLTPVRITVGTTSLDASSITTGFYTLVTGGADGTRVDGIRVTSSGDLSGTSNFLQKVIRIFITDSGGTLASVRLIAELYFAPVGYTLITNTSARPAASLSFDQPIILRPGQKIVVTSTAYVTTIDQMDVIAFAGDY